MVSTVEQLIKSEVLLTTSYNGCHKIYFKGLWQDFVQFLCQTKMNSIDRIKEMVTIAFVYCTGL